MFTLIALAIIAVCVGLMFIPQFGLLNAYKGKSNYTYNAYETIFYFTTRPYKNYLKDNASGGRASAGGIIALIFLLLGAVSLGLSKKSSVLSLLGGLLVAISGILFLMTPLWMLIIYNGKITAGWLAYVVGGVLLLVGAFISYIAIMRLRDEKNELARPKSQQYSYLKNK